MHYIKGMKEALRVLFTRFDQKRMKNSLKSDRDRRNMDANF